MTFDEAAIQATSHTAQVLAACYAQAPLACTADGREFAMVRMFAEGNTMAEIGERFHITKQRVHQIISRSGIAGSLGGAQKKRRQHKQDRDDFKRRTFEQRMGCSKERYQELRKIGASMISAGFSYRQTPIGAFAVQRCNAKIRNIEWCLTVWEWWIIWLESGRWSARGARLDKYVMCRRGDVGPYAKDNVYIATSAHNQAERVKSMAARRMVVR